MIVQPSGLIFLVIIAIWATYLLQHWVRRREHLATARSVDRFSDAMRVLERHAPLPALDLAAGQPRSYVVSPARPSRPEVVVTRFEASASPVSRRLEAEVRAPRGRHALAGMSARRIRGLSFLMSSSLVVVVGPLAALSLTPWWSFPAAVAVLAVDFAILRHAAVAERSARRSHASSRRAKAAVHHAAGAAPWAARPVTQSLAVPEGQSEPVVVTSSVVEGSVVETRTPPADADLSGWAPVPVPPPTYTLKAKAERPEPAPAAVIQPETARPSSFDGLVDDDELDGLLDRRAAGA
jgi:membrane protein implicated in regulation of membrane protease activity